MTYGTDVVLPGAGRNSSLMRAFEVLEALARHAEGASVATLARETDLPRATVTRLLASLADARAVARTAHGKSWTLGPTIVRLGRALGGLAALRDRARPLLEELVAAIGETVMLSVPYGPASAQVVEEVEAPCVVGVRAGWTGSVLTTPASGDVRMVLAELADDALASTVASMTLTALTPRTITSPSELLTTIDRIRGEGYSIVIDQLEMGLSGLGVPVRRHGVLMAMLSVYMPTPRFDDAMRTRALPLLRGAAPRLAR